MKKNNARKTNLILFGIAALFLAGNIYAFYIKEYSDNIVIKENVSPFDAEYVYNFYIAPAPDISDRPYYGNPDAGITIIAYLDIESAASRYFISEIFPKLEEEYIKTGRAKFYSKSYIAFDDVRNKSDNFIYASYLSCVESVKKDAYYRFYFELFNISGIGQLPGLLEKHRIPKNEMDRCMKGQTFKNIKIDAAEVEAFGMLGVAPRLYIGLAGQGNTVLDGIPQYAKLNQTIREYEFLTGN